MQSPPPPLQPRDCPAGPKAAPFAAAWGVPCGPGSVPLFLLISSRRFCLFRGLAAACLRALIKSIQEGRAAGPSGARTFHNVNPQPAPRLRGGLGWRSSTALGRLDTLTATPSIVAPVRHRA